MAAFLSVEGFINTQCLLAVLIAMIGILFIYFEKRNLPPGPMGLPWFGYLSFLKDPESHLHLHKLAKQYGDVLSFSLFGQTYVSLNSLDVIKEAFIRRSDEFNGRPQNYSWQTWLDGNYGIIQTEGQPWKEQRRFFLQSMKNFSTGKAKMEGRVHELILHLIERVKETQAQPFNIHKDLVNITCNVFVQLAFNKEYNINDPEFRRIVNSTRVLIDAFLSIKALVVGVLAWLYIAVLPGRREMKEAKETLQRVVDEAVRDHEEMLDRNNIKNFTDAYLDEIERTKEKRMNASSFILQRLKATEILMFVDGIETTGISIYLLLQELLHHPEVQAKVQMELDDVVGRERLPCLADRPNLPYTEATIAELQRFVSPFPLSVTHSNPKTTTLRGYKIPARSVLIPNIWSVHHDPNLWPDPDTFDPNHFLGSDGKLAKKEGPFIFSIGKRSCPGEGLGQIEIFLVITALMQNFTLLPAVREKEDPGDYEYSLRAIPRLL